MKIIYLYMDFLLILITPPDWLRAVASTIRFLIFGFNEL